MRTAYNFWGEKVTYDERAYQDIDGNPVERDPIAYRNFHDPYVIYMSENFSKDIDKIVYSDRVVHDHYSEKEINTAANEVSKKTSWHYPNIAYVTDLWENPKKVSEFLSLLMNKKVRCTAILKGVYYNGYPIWTIYFRPC